MSQSEQDLHRPPQERFDPSHVQALLEHYPQNIKEYAPGERFIQQGKKGILDRDLFVGVKGNMRVVRANEKGETELDITLSGEGAIVGEMALMAPILNTALKKTREVEHRTVEIARSASVSAGDFGLRVVRLSPDEVLKWNGEKNYPFNEMYTIVSELARKRLADADRAKVGMVDVWHLPPPTPRPEVKESPSQTKPIEVFKGFSGGPLGRRLNRRPTNS